MKKLLVIYFSLVMMFLDETVIFICFHWSIFSQYEMSDLLQVFPHSLPHDLTLAGYVIALPLLLRLVNIWLPGKWFRKFCLVFLEIIGTLLFLIWMVDLVLFGYWKFRMDATPLIYLRDNPGEVLGQVPVWQYLLAIAVLAAFVWLFHKGLSAFWPACQKVKQSIQSRLFETIGGIVLAILCFVVIRGGVTESTMNVGRAYFSSEQMLNQAAVNPVFSFLYSLSKEENYDKMYRFMSDSECDEALDDLAKETRYGSDILLQKTGQQEPLKLLKTDRPNILLIILEGFSGKCVTALHPEADPRIMPCMSRLYNEGIGWTRFFASSWRTDRGVAAILASYPAQPKNTVMKDQSKCNHLQYLPLRLKEEGYHLQFVYGGDINFTNMQGFLRSGGVDQVVSMDQFPAKDRLQKWGVPDELTFDYMYHQMEEATTPYCKMMLTLSSHEPYDVPDFHRLDHPFANSYAYTDSCLGNFIDELRANPKIWDNLLVVVLPDHGTDYPDMALQMPVRYHIPMIWTGGALRTDTLADGKPASPRLIDALGGQIDLGATLLGQLGIHHEDFNFSKDLLDPNASHFAFFDFPDGLGMIADVADTVGIRTLTYVQDNEADGVPLKESNDPEGKVQLWGRAYLQRLFDDLSKR